MTNAYSLGELVAYVSECPEGGMHVSPDYGVVQLSSRPGTGDHEIIATGLFNRAMPLLRYRTGDLAVPSEGGPCCGRGLPRVDDLIGRVDDLVHTPEGSVVGPAPMSLAFQRVPHLVRAQVVQDDPSAIEIRAEVSPGWIDDDEAFLVRELRKRLGSRLAITVELVDSLTRTGGGKERLIISTVGAS
ncbi:MAG: hypothetical protein R2698_05855 [Microthrixaceae bacterium]